MGPVGLQAIVNNAATGLTNVQVLHCFETNDETDLCCCEQHSDRKQHDF